MYLQYSVGVKELPNEFLQRLYNCQRNNLRLAEDFRPFSDNLGRFSQRDSNASCHLEMYVVTLRLRFAICITMVSCTCDCCILYTVHCCTILLRSCSLCCPLLYRSHAVFVLSVAIHASGISMVISRRTKISEGNSSVFGHS